MTVKPGNPYSRLVLIGESESDYDEQISLVNESDSGVER
jgi:hypothetical protein